MPPSILNPSTHCGAQSAVGQKWATCTPGMLYKASWAPQSRGARSARTSPPQRARAARASYRKRCNCSEGPEKNFGGKNEYNEGMLTLALVRGDPRLPHTPGTKP